VNTIERQFEVKHIADILRINEDIAEMLDKAAEQIAMSVSSLRGKAMQRQINAALASLRENMKQTITNAVREQWALANEKNDELVKSVVRGIPVAPVAMESMSVLNLGALESFIARKMNGMNLSERVWNFTGQNKALLETYVGSGIIQGRAATKIAEDVRFLLKEPDKAFHRIRDDKGRLVLSEAAKAYHPGPGVYRSSYQDALRLAATETNMAYRSADSLRRQQLPFVVGIEIHLSNAHPEPDICDAMAGEYPVGYWFDGWHPRCLCYTTSVMLSRPEIIKYFKTGRVDNRRYIRAIPRKAEAYLARNAAKLNRNPPYFWRNNFTNGVLKRDVVQPKILVNPYATPGDPRIAERFQRSSQYMLERWGASDMARAMYQTGMMLDCPGAKQVLARYGMTREAIYEKIISARAQQARLINKYGDEIIEVSRRLNQVDGVYTRTRDELHQKIIDSFINKIPSTTKPELLMTGGYPGSGKSTMLDFAFPGWKESFVHIDSDAVKVMLAENDGFKSLGWRASFYHGEAGDIVSEIQNRAIAERKSVLFDGTMNNLKKTEGIVKKYEKEGYSVRMAYADLPMEEAVARAVGRFLDPKDGRFVDPAFIVTNEDKNFRTFEAIRGMAKSWVHYDTNVPKGTAPRLVGKSK